MPYIYNDEDNVPMNDDAFDGIHNPTVYSSRSEMKAAEQPLPFTDPPENGCWNCMNFDWKHEACTTRWNNMDEDYYNPDIDDRKPEDCCEDWELNPDSEWEDWH
ncbi:MAG: hypothetical protein J6Y48_14890 [Clostridia bacterium]|nr:hypothetical protein [Clostridia bacterium]